MTFCIGVNPRYHYRLPQVADFLHISLPFMWPNVYQLKGSNSEVYHLGKLSTSYNYSNYPKPFRSSQNQRQKLTRIVLFNYNWCFFTRESIFRCASKGKIKTKFRHNLESFEIWHSEFWRKTNNFNPKFQLAFQRLFPDLELDDYFTSSQYAFGRPKSLGTVTPIDLQMDTPLHSNWGTSDCVKFHVSKLRLFEYFLFLGMIKISYLLIRLNNSYFRTHHHPQSLSSEPIGFWHRISISQRSWFLYNA